MTLPGAPPPQGNFPPPLPADTQRGIDTGVTSPHTGDRLDMIRTAILALQHYAEGETDDVELQQVSKCILALQSILADHHKNKDAALGVTPSMRHVRRVAGGNY